MEIILLLLLVTLIPFVAKLWTIYIPKLKGRIGENYVAYLLLQLPKNEYFVINNVFLKDEYYSTQIDHIVVSIYGIFVIETKNYSGWITGYENSEYWYKNMFGHKYSFYNPIKQNKGHIIALKKKLHLKTDKFISIVAFSDKCDLKTNTSSEVVYISDIIPLIQQYRVIKFNKTDIQNIITQILLVNATTNTSEKEHIVKIYSKIKRDKKMLEQCKCPKCGHYLVLRYGRYGKFLGCSNYPKCKFTQKF